MHYRGVRVLLCLLFLAHHSFQETPSKKKSGKKGGNTAAIEELKKQVEDIMQDVRLLKEQQALQRVCLKGTKIDDKCFLAVSTKKSYHVANEDCMAMGGTLSTPVTGDENDQLYEYVRRRMGPEVQVWLGINDMVSEGHWVDMSGSSVRYKNWETEITRQPDGGRTHNCAVLSTTANGKWFDESCKVEKAFVCEFNIV
ncbi:tetranectin-like isoform X2 [Brienomyrus brachyistius]|uniref:tetranectin-like isoform X2 n=1 Tax=Brienomyrus brachyistius TaxID=42636 RepID=UPI0020B3BD0E|nr:tetranectin-like isoform X2 [Brienomyrus brachyistius]